MIEPIKKPLILWLLWPLWTASIVVCTMGYFILSLGFSIGAFVVIREQMKYNDRHNAALTYWRAHQFILEDFHNWHEEALALCGPHPNMAEMLQAMRTLRAPIPFASDNSQLVQKAYADYVSNRCELAFREQTPSEIEPGKIWRWHIDPTRLVRYPQFEASPTVQFPDLRYEKDGRVSFGEKAIVYNL